MDLNQRPTLDVDLQAVDDIIMKTICSDVPLAEHVTGHLLKAGGKRLRPRLVLMSHGVFSQNHNHTLKTAQLLAAAVEFLHNATLLHDDVIDEATTRRHQPSSNAVYGDKASILGGDYLFSRGFETMVKTGRIDVLTVLSKASRIIIEGELLQLMHSGSFDLTLETYFQITQAKTAVLFSAACEVGALSANASSNDVQALAQFGEHLGMAFQMIDDILDYEGEEGVLGKSIGNDLMEGKVTLPLLLCHKDLNDHDKEHFEAAFLKKDLEKCLFYLNQTKAFYKSRILAQRHCEHAHNILMPYQSSPAAQRLQNLCAISLKRAA